MEPQSSTSRESPDDSSIDTPDHQRLIKDHEADKELAKLAIIDFDLRHRFKTNFMLREIYAENHGRLKDMYHKMEMARYGRRIKRNMLDRDLFQEMDVCLREKSTKTNDEIAFMQLYARYKEEYVANKLYQVEFRKFFLRCMDFSVKYPWRRDQTMDLFEYMHTTFPCLKLRYVEHEGNPSFIVGDKIFNLIFN